MRPIAHRVLRDAKQVGHLGIALTAIEYERKHGTLVGWQSVELCHVKKLPSPLSDTKRRM
jgi:hypothetical protein